MCFGKIEGRGVEVGTSENLVTSQCCTIQENPERDKIQITFHAYLVSKTLLCVVQKNTLLLLLLGAVFSIIFFLLRLNHYF